MELMPPPQTRPAEHALRAHLAHASHHEQLGDGQELRLTEAINGIGNAAPAPAAPTRKPRRRRAK